MTDWHDTVVTVTRKSRVRQKVFNAPLQRHVAGIFDWSTLGTLDYFAFNSHLVLCAVNINVLSLRPTLQLMTNNDMHQCNF